MMRPKINAPSGLKPATTGLGTCGIKLWYYILFTNSSNSLLCSIWTYILYPHSIHSKAK